MRHIQRVTKERWSCVNLVPRVLYPWRVRREGVKRYPGYEFGVVFARQSFFVPLSFLFFFSRRMYELISTHVSPHQNICLFVCLFIFRIVYAKNLNIRRNY